MKQIAERIAMKAESIYTGLYAVHTLLVEEIEKAITKDYSVSSALGAINEVYPISSTPSLHIMKIIEVEMSL